MNNPREVFDLIFENESQARSDTDPKYTLKLQNIMEDVFTDGEKYFQITEDSVYVISEVKGKKKKRKVARRKGKNLVLTNKKDKIIFSPEVLVAQSNSYF